MGGFGSGRQKFDNAKSTTNKHRSIDIRDWHRDGFLKTNTYFTWNWIVNGEKEGSIAVHVKKSDIILNYRYQLNDQAWKEINTSINISWTSCNYGGKRPWFLCPTPTCQKRVAILYSSGVFVCRHCHKLAYESQRERAYDRAARRADKIRKRLEWEQGILNPRGWKKPKGMHWKTFRSLVAKQDMFSSSAFSGIAQRYGFKHKIFDDWD